VSMRMGNGKGSGEIFVLDVDDEKRAVHEIGPWLMDSGARFGPDSLERVEERTGSEPVSFSQQSSASGGGHFG
jgi:hypothetical protein